MSDPARTPYDAVIYPSYTHTRSHAGHLYAQATLYGVDPAPPTACRMLEIGCGNASTLVPMAYTLPGSRFVGVDLAAEPLARGRRMAADLGLTNIELMQADLLRVGHELGPFDYIVAHGLYSWVSPEVRDGLLRLCGELLAPNGVAFVSYLAYPGSHVRQMLRDILLYHLGDLEDPKVVLPEARSLAQWLADVPLTDDPFQAALRAEAQRFVKGDPDHLFHDDLTEWNSPAYFVQFFGHAAAHGLQFLAEADQSEMEDYALPAETRRQLDILATDRIRRQQYLDFVKARRFRQTLLCHSELAVLDQASHDRVGSLYVSSSAVTADGSIDLRADVEVSFSTGSGPSLATHFPLGKAALAELMQQWPGRLAFVDLEDAARRRLRAAGVADPGPGAGAELREFVVRLNGVGLAGVHGHAPAVSRGGGDRPRVSAVARWQAREDGYLSSLNQIGYTFDEPRQRAVIPFIDGTRDRAALAALEGSDVELIDELLDTLGELAFLEG